MGIKLGNNNDNNNEKNSGLLGCLPLVGILILIFFLFSACGNMFDSEPVSNDWDADGDAFDRDDMDAYFEYKEGN
jgi:hypothetical protein